MRAEAFILVAAAGAALVPSHVTNRRTVALRALTADALETKRLQCFSAFDELETRLAMRLIAAAESEEASLADSASEAFASSLARLRRCAFPGAVDAAWRDGELTAWNWTAPLVSACNDIARELQTVLSGDAGGWDGAEYQAIAADWSFLYGDELTVAVAQWLQMRALRPNTSGRPFQGTIEEALELIIVGEPQYGEPLGEPQ